jgi:hypothetical protein
MFYRPLRRLTGLTPFFIYQILSTVVQCIWVVAVWILCRIANISRQSSAMVILLSIFSGFFLLNSIFVWPKFLAGALLAFSFIFLLLPTLHSQSLTSTQAAFSAISAALAFLAHGGVVFSAPAIILAAVGARPLLGFSRILIGFTLFAMLLIPWNLYQKFYEPPGNRLVKWHIGGAVTVDERSTLQTIRDSYASLTTAQFFQNKLENIKALVGNISATPIKRREAQFFNLFQSLGILNFSWILFAAALFSKSIREKIGGRATMIMLVGSILSLFLWVLAMFIPGTTLVHQGSYTTMILLFTSLGIIISTLPSFFCYLLLLVHMIDFFITWIFSTPPKPLNSVIYAPDLPMIILGLSAFIAVALIYIGCGSQYFIRRHPTKPNEPLFF